MKKQMILKLIIVVVLNVMILSIGTASMAAVKDPILTRWSHISSTSYLFDKDQELENYDILACGGITTVPSTKYAYVKVDLEYLDGNTWKNFATWTDQGRVSAGVEEYVQVTPGYTYRLKLTHKALDANGNVLETFYDEADYYIASFSRN